ncbi:hypothetical protein [Flavobacterium psychrophilum]|uniref:hypothetical protein n=1 Tax=Flavobacterium psychrophilum TaxID=96345 RepID=UPI00106B690D|nr:hypothetical protein [Flavobacterium psychrophilum]
MAKADGVLENTAGVQEHIIKQEHEYFNTRSDENPLVVRFSTKSQKHFYFKSENGRGFSVKKFKNRKEAHDFSRKNKLYHKSEKEEEIVVHIDKDGNYEVRNQIAKYSEIRVSQGTLISNFTNYTISHIWAKTEHPLFFTALWNVTLIPTYLGFILDKPDENSEIVRKLKLIMQGLCYEFYKPAIINETEIKRLKTSIEFAKKCQSENYNFTFI